MLLPNRQAIDNRYLRNVKAPDEDVKCRGHNTKWSRRRPFFYGYSTRTETGVNNDWISKERKSIVLVRRKDW